MNVAIMGGGDFGSCMAYTLTKYNKADVVVYNRTAISDDKLIKNCKYTYDINEVKNGNFDFIFYCISSNGIEELNRQLHGLSTNILICTKGISKNEDIFFSDIISESNPDSNISVLSGPNFASEILAGVPTITTIASKNLQDAKAYIELFEGTNIEIHISTKVYQTQLMGSMKNIMAIYIGYMYGNDFGMNEIIKNTVNMLKDSKELIKIFDQMPDMIQPCSIGDVILTCFNEKSRNRTFGYLIAKNQHTEENKKAEGYNNYIAIKKICNKYGIVLNSFQAVFDILDNV